MSDILRMAELVKYLEDGVCSVRQIADRIEVSTKTVRRDMDFLREFLGMQAHWDDAAKRWTLKKRPRSPW